MNIVTVIVTATALMMQAASTSETFVNLYQTTQCDNQKTAIFKYKILSINITKWIDSREQSEVRVTKLMHTLHMILPSGIHGVESQ
jgi:hypothetical protein